MYIICIIYLDYLLLIFIIYSESYTPKAEQTLLLFYVMIFLKEILWDSRWNFINQEKKVE